MTITERLYDLSQGLFKSALRPPQVINLREPHAECKLTLMEAEQEIHDGVGLSGPIKVPVWGYQGAKFDFCSPGPILLTEKDHSVSITWKNSLPTRRRGNNIFPFDFQGELPPVLAEKIPDCKAGIITHLHGAAIPSGSDGWPTESYAPGQRRTHHYHNQQPAATVWYHDHAMDQTGLNVYAGIAGGYVILDNIDQVLAGYLSSLGSGGLGWAESFGQGPAGIPLVIQDRLLSDSGAEIRYVYQTNYENTAVKVGEQSVAVGKGGEFFGRINLVNGQVSPHLQAGPSALRFKLLNGCNSRFLVLCFVDENDDLQPVPVYQIGDDHGRRDQAEPYALKIAPLCPEQPRAEPLDVVKPIRIGPGERLDVIADFSGFRNRKLRLVDIGRAPFQGNIPEWVNAIPQNPYSPSSLNPDAVKARIESKRTHKFELDGAGNDTTTYNNYPEILQFEIADVASAKPVDIDTLSRILLTGNAVKTRVIALREFVMYSEGNCGMNTHPGHEAMPHFVERCSPDLFANTNANEAAAMLVLEELEEARDGDPVVIESRFDLFDAVNRALKASYKYKVTGNTAGTLIGNDVSRYQGDMKNAWISQPYVVKSNSTEVWRFVNLTGDTHPMHIHLTGFRIVESLPIACADPGLSYIPDLHVPEPDFTKGIPAPSVAPNLPIHLQGCKDTVQVDPGTILTVIGKFEGGTGRYVYHCHMLEHEDHMMMRKFKVV